MEIGIGCLIFLYLFFTSIGSFLFEDCYSIKCVFLIFELITIIACFTMLLEISDTKYYKQGYIDATYNTVKIDTISLDKNGRITDFKIIQE